MTEHSKHFQKYYDRYQRGGCTKEQLRKLTDLGVITQDEFKEITGEDFYPTPNEESAEEAN